MRTRGTLTTWNDARGFGFITPSDGGRRVFVHISAFANRELRPEVNQVVTFTQSSDERGRPRAIDASLAGDRVSRIRRLSRLPLPLIGAWAFLGLVGVLAAVGRVAPTVLGGYLVLSALTFAAYAMDKSAARKGAWRTKESSLHFLSLAGGWPGALLAQQRLRHKTRKPSFRLIFWVTVLVNLGVFVWLMTPMGSESLRFS
jgi:uncharacterized membrane protein YsdA (DUF1294 family)/cold shock CspA family protein